ncbi:hypothetical protein TvY486_0002310, partial [Trypanosoma vivax Y486]
MGVSVTPTTLTSPAAIAHTLAASSPPSRLGDARKSPPTRAAASPHLGPKNTPSSSPSNEAQRPSSCRGYLASSRKKAHNGPTRASTSSTRLSDSSSVMWRHIHKIKRVHHGEADRVWHSRHTRPQVHGRQWHSSSLIANLERNHLVLRVPSNRSHARVLGSALGRHFILTTTLSTTLSYMSAHQQSFSSTSAARPGISSAFA